MMTAVIGALLLATGVTSGSLALLFIGRFMAGIGEGNTAILQSLASDVSSPATKARNFAAIGIAMDLGFVAGPILGGMLADPAFTRDVVSKELAMALPFWTAVGLFIVNAAAIPFFLKADAPAIHADVAEPAASIIPTAMSPSIRSLLVITFLTYWTIMIFFDFFPVFFVQLYNTPPGNWG